MRTVPTRFAAVRSRNFRLLWLGLLVSHTGTWMATVGIGWTVYALTGSPLYLGLNSLAFAVPMLVLPAMSFIGAPSLGGLVVGAAATVAGAPAALLAGAAVVATAVIAIGARTLMRE